MSRSVVVSHALRTVQAKSGTALRDVGAVELGRQVLVELVESADLDPELIDEVVLGCVASPPDAANIARVVALKAELPRSIPAVTVQRNCGSGMEALACGVERVRSGRARVVVAGGVESMSGYPLLFGKGAKRLFEELYGARSATARLAVMARFRPRHFVPGSGLEVGLRDPVCGLSMGETAEVLAKEFRIPRESQDELALLSHARAVRAEDAGHFDSERIAVRMPPTFVDAVETDVGPRRGQTLEKLARLQPAFDRKHGTVTAGNSCMVTDGAAALLVMAERTAIDLGYDPLGRVAGYGWAGCSPPHMGLGPCYAVPRALDDAGVGFESIELIELNEAFAAQVIACEICFRSRAFARDELGRERAIGQIDRDRMNVNGGAIALGHPVGATGARIVVTLLHEMKRRSAGVGLATECIGGGQGGAMVLRR